MRMATTSTPATKTVAISRRCLAAVTVIGLATGGITGAAPASARSAQTGSVPAATGALHRPAASFVDIHPSGFTESVAADLNDRGEVIGVASDVVEGVRGVPLAFLWRNGVRTVLRPLPGYQGSSARDLNERGDVIGTCEQETTGWPCFWRHGRPRDMGTADWCGTAAPMALNDKGEVVGECLAPGRESRAFLWRNGVFTDLGGAGARIGWKLNNRSQVAGLWADRYAEDPRGFFWQRGVVTDLGTLGGTRTMVSAINDRGQVVGESTTADGSLHAFFWQNGRMTDLGTLPGDRDSSAVAINEWGQIVGWSGASGGGSTHAVLWNHGVPISLGTLPGDVRSVAENINERGQVVGSSSNATNTRNVAFLWERGRMIAVSRPAQGWA